MAAPTALRPFDALIDDARSAAQHAAPAPRTPRAIQHREPELALERFASLEATATGERSRRGFTLPVSFVLHAAGVAAVAVLPLLVVEGVPEGAQGVRAFFAEPMGIPAAPPPPPPPAPARAASAVKPAVKPAAAPIGFTAPIEVPTAIVPEAGLDLGVEGGVPGGVEGGVPGGVVGGVVAGLPDAPPPVEVKPVRVGGEVREPRKVKDVAAQYPELALKARVEGIVIIEATIDARGRVQNATVLRGLPVLDEAALAAVRQWVYTPTLLNGVPTPIIMTVTVNFRLRNN